jgi:3-methyladenine DNA glycosylase AlkD
MRRTAPPETCVTLACMHAAARALIADMRETLAACADAKRAPAMQAYMKSAMPYHGVSAVPMRAACKQVFARHPLPSFVAWRDAVLGLFRGATHREQRYAALALAGARAYRGHRTLAALPIFEEIIETGAWWDLVDDVAAHRIGELLRAHPVQMKRTLLRWARGKDMWKARSAIISQLGFKQDTDLAFLYACIEPSLDSREFFLRKAIGWALRQYAWTDPDEVVRYVRERGDRLSGLSRREALKNVKPHRTARAAAERGRAKRRAKC